MRNFGKVKAWEEIVTIPTYPVDKADKNPLFLEKRVYQGSSGKVYPHPVTDKVSDVKIDVQYKAVFLENDFLKIMILPELGGRVQRAYDKMRNYDFVYYNHVIKPALVGLVGPWISGGIEFNWPQHHRPSTFDEVNYSYVENSDGSASVICSEIENMFHTKAMTEFTLYPDKAYLELNNHLFNRTNTKQTFLWWANPAVAVNENYRSIFPPDVTAVMDHGKRAVSTFPIATGEYYKVDYSSGVDISRYENLPVPTSYMAAKSDFDFVGGYDEGVRAGLLHVADHHVSPGKKQWTWGSGEFGKAWDELLTDEDGPYFELMTGCFTDNQPDFGYIGPMETRDFKQYFMPYHEIGTVHNATKDIVLRVDNGDDITLNIYCSGTLGECEAVIYGKDEELHRESLNLICGEYYEIKAKGKKYNFEDTSVRIYKNGNEVITFSGDFKKHEIPDPQTAAPDPEECETLEDLYLYGLHIEQYRHATRRAEDYYLEGLRREEGDIRLNNAYGLLLLKKTLFSESEKYFRRALRKQTRSNPNPINGEVYYNLGLCFYYQNRMSEAFDAFYKATWNAETQSNAFYFMALISSKRKKYENALEFINKSIIYNVHNSNAINLRIMLLKKLGMSFDETVNFALSFDKLNILALYLNGESIEKHIINPNMLIDLSLEFANAGFYEDAVKLLSNYGANFPMIHYYKAYFAYNGELEYKDYLSQAFAAPVDYCFPNRIEDTVVLKFAMENNASDFKAPYYLGCLYFDRELHDMAISLFEKSISMGCDFATSYRNLSMLYFNELGDAKCALELMQRAFDMDKTDARVLYELDLLKNRVGIPAKERIEYLENYLELVDDRDDLYLEYITLNNLIGNYAKALDLLHLRKFHPWEGGEGKVPQQYVLANIALALQNPDKAVEYLNATYDYPKNFGEGKLFGTQENRQNYYLALAYLRADDKENAEKLFEKASVGISEPQSAMYYNDQPPETIFYQGMAHLRLGRSDEARYRFNKLIEYADKHMNDIVKIDFFAVSLPDLLVFNDDLNLKNKLHCMFMKALGLYGLDKKEESKILFEEALKLAPNHFTISTHYRLLF